jgi:diamine N-acetyltransferase
MNFSIYLRPLQIEDALISCHWRNNPRLWRFTGSRPDRHITPEIETEWLADVLQRSDERRFAICVKGNDRYIGNVFLTGITNGQAELHIFIGDTDYWGQGRADQACWLLLEHGFHVLGLEMVYCRINKKNQSSLAVVNRMQWQPAGEYNDDLLKFTFTRQMFNLIYDLNNNTYLES